MLRKWMAITLSVMMVFTMMPVCAYAETTTFSDMPQDWSTAALESAVDNGLLNGSNGRIMPQENLTRAQMAAVINRAFGSENVAVLAEYDDVKASDWFFLDMAKAVAMGTFQGSGGKLNPNDSITREQAFAVMARALKLEISEVVPTGFTDLDKVSDWASGEVFALVNSGYIQGSNGMLNPQGHITRAEFAQVMFNTIKEYINEAGEYSLDLEGNLMINVPDVTLVDSNVEGDLIIGDGVGEGEVVLDNVNVTGRLLVRGGGAESIIIKGDSVVGSITIAKVDGEVRIFAEDGTEVGTVLVDGKDDVIVEGAFEGVVVAVPDVTVWATAATIASAQVIGEESKLVIDEDSTVDKLVLSGVKSAVEVNGQVEEIETTEAAIDALITVEEDGSVEHVVANGQGTAVEGVGTVDSVEANADDVIVVTEGTEVTAAEGVEGVMAGEEEVEAGDSTTVEDETTGGSSGSSYVSPRLRSADLNGVEAVIDGDDVTVTYEFDGEHGNYVISAEFNKRVKVKSVSSSANESVDIDFIENNITDDDVPTDYSSTLVYGFEHTITEEHFTTFGDEFDVVVTDGTRDLEFTITIDYSFN